MSNSDSGTGDPNPDAATSRSRVEALVHLLGDENPKVYTTAWKHLEEMGPRAIRLVEGAARGSDDSRTRLRAGKFLTEWKQREVLDDWTRSCDTGNLDLEQGALLISRSEYSNETSEGPRAQLDEYAHILRRRLGSTRTTESAAQKTVQFLSGEIGFSGRGVDYKDPANSYLHKVLERKSGLPILLSTVYLCVARRVGLALRAVGMPQHFVVKYRTSDEERFVDPFHGGRTLTRWDCRNFLAKSGVPFQESYLREISDREVLSRMLGNLLRVYHAKQDQKRLNRVIMMLRALEGQSSPAKR